MSAEVKPKFAMYWAAGCGGCEIAVLNIDEAILDVHQFRKDRVQYDHVVRVVDPRLLVDLPLVDPGESEDGRAPAFCTEVREGECIVSLPERCSGKGLCCHHSTLSASSVKSDLIHSRASVVGNHVPHFKVYVRRMQNGSV